ncbi:MAG: hypothetical protein Q4A74_03560 [Cardiobacteriaceae bacterium]|nr:hypothetical protein [Cardiobacteriaceae bacterium]
MLEAIAHSLDESLMKLLILSTINTRLKQSLQKIYAAIAHLSFCMSDDEDVWLDAVFFWCAASGKNGSMP